MAQQNDRPQNTNNRNIHFLPKLRKNRRVELRWGTKYYEAVKIAVFTMHTHLPYMPEEPPQSLKKEIDKTGYVCKQCRDCFRFLSSIEEHTSRRSWVLGYWCDKCFMTNCAHKGPGKPNCSTCVEVESSKLDYLRSKGLKKHAKKGVTKIFYNQCQFFAHLKTHGVSSVDLGDLMLMPLPSGFKPEQNGKLDKIWRAVMEVMFIRNIHIMDWLRDMKISWSVVLNADTQKTHPVIEIISRYAEDCIRFTDKSESSRQDNPIQFEDTRKTAKSVGSSGNSIQPKSVSGDTRRNTINVPSARPSEKKFVQDDIAFVDCGPTPNICLSDSPAISILDQSHKNSDKISNVKGSLSLPAAKKTLNPQNPLEKKFSQISDKLGEKFRDKTLKAVEDRISTSSLPAINRSGPRVLTIRSPRNLNISAIINLTTDPMNHQRIAVANDSKAKNGLTGTSESSIAKVNHTATLESSLADKSVSLIPITPENNVKTSTSPQVAPNIVIKPNNNPGKPPSALSQSFSEQMSLHGKIVFQNGRKYIIRHVPKAKYQTIVQAPKPTNNLSPNPPPLMMSVLGQKRLLVSQATSASKKLPSATPVPIPKTVSTNKSVVINRQLKCIKPSEEATTSTSCPLVPLTSPFKSYSARIREARIDMQKSKKDLRVYIENMKKINEAYSKAMGVDSDIIIQANLKTIEHFESLVTDEPPSNDIKDDPDKQTEDKYDTIAKSWESRIDKIPISKCETCDKRVKPKSYIIGISGPAADESLFCQCYNTICYLCNTNLGTSGQLKAHIKWHKREEPFVCPDCCIWFKSAQELEVHMWTTCFHPLVRHVYSCKICEIRGISNMEEVAKHFLLTHTRKKYICPDCKMEYKEPVPTSYDCKRHCDRYHRATNDIFEPKRLLLCSIKLCIVPPESFRAHLTEHIGIVTSVYYKCPFCPMITRDVDDRLKRKIRQHMIKHLDRFHEVVNPDSLQQVLQKIVFKRSNLDLCTTEVTNANTSGPMIINARTITPASFELGTESADEEREDSSLPKILEVRSEATEEYETGDSAETDFTGTPLMAVESGIENAAESPAPKSEMSDALSQESISDELTSLSEDATVVLKEYIEDDSSNSYEDMTIVIKDSDTEDNKMDFNFSCSLPKLEKKPSCLLEANDESQEWNEKYQNECISSLETGNLKQRPWRIALNTPTNPGATPVTYNCHLCGELINTSWSVIKNHFKSRHANDYELSVVSPQIPQISSEYITGECREDCNIRKRKPETCINVVTKKKRRWGGARKFVEKPGSPSLGLCVRPETVQEVEGSFRCKKCDEPFEEIAMMREHIATKHRIKGQYLICLECGENFVVVPSLQMHLKALHGIQDPITYLAKNTAYAPDTPDDMEEDEKTTESNQCYVCMAVFEDKPAVDKHLRVHGMAFLRRKRFEAQKAQKCSEKKDVQPDNTNNSVKSDENMKTTEEASNKSSNNLATPNIDSIAGSSDKKTITFEKPMKFWVKKFDFPVPRDAELSVVQNRTSITESSSTGISKETETS